MEKLIDIIVESFQKHSNEAAIITHKSLFTYSDVAHISRKISNQIAKGSNDHIIFIYSENKLVLLISAIACILAGKVFCAIPKKMSTDLRAYLNKVPSQTLISGPNELNSIEKSYLKDMNIMTIDISASKNADVHILHSASDVLFTNGILFDNNDILYIYFTSGSTNTPKAILGSEKGLIHFIKWQYSIISQNIVVAQISSPWFDPYLREIFLPLCFGGCIVLPTKNDLVDNKRFISWLNKSKITILNIVPTIFRRLFLSEKHVCLSSLNYIFLAGEMLFYKDIQMFRTFYLKNVIIYNLYGPSETTLAKFYHKIEELGENQVPVGKPLPNTEFKLSKSSNQNDMNNGEVLIITEYASHGYIDKDPERNEFILSSFPKNNEGQSIFYTGDIGEINDKGELLLTGRKNNIFKYHGEKVNLEELEAVICHHPSVKNCISVIIGNRKPIIASAVIPVKGVLTLSDKEEIRNAIRLNFSNSVIPKYFFEFNTFPINANGKVNRNDIKSNIEMRIMGEGYEQE